MRTPAQSIPASPDKVQLFLFECANLCNAAGAAVWPDPRDALRLAKRFPEFVWQEPWPIFGAAPSTIGDFLGMVPQSGDDLLTARLGNRQWGEPEWVAFVFVQIGCLRGTLRSLWEAHNEREAFWRMNTAIQDFIKFLGVTKSESADLSVLSSFFSPGAMPQQLEQSLWTLFKEKQRGRARVCENPDCPARYYFATRRDQRYCTAECSRPAQKAAKRAWWDKRGSAWREQKRKGKASKTPKGS